MGGWVGVCVATLGCSFERFSSCPRGPSRLSCAGDRMVNNLDKIKPVRFPTVWLTYKARIRGDFDRAYSAEGGAEYFDSDYFSRLCAQIKQLEDWLIKLFVLQISLTGFQVIGFVGNDASISLFGITLKQATGVKEILIAFYAFIAVATWMIIISRDTVQTVL